MSRAWLDEQDRIECESAGAEMKEALAQSASAFSGTLVLDR